MAETIHELLCEGLRIAGAETVLETPEGRRLSGTELEGLAGGLAWQLRQLGATPGERVMAIVDKSPDALGLYLACLRAGAVFVPVNPSLRRRELDHVIIDAEPRVIVCRPELEETALDAVGERVGVEVRTLDAEGAGSITTSGGASGTLAPEGISSDDVAVMLYTSGTTGKPKGAMLTQGNLASNARALTEAWGFGRDDVLLHTLPLFHVHGLFVATHCALMVGAKMVLHSAFEVDQVLAALPRISVMMGVPTFYARLLKRPELSRHRCERVRLFTSGSAPLGGETFAAFEERTGHRIVERYGMTETLINTTNPVDGERRVGSVGRALPGVELRLGEGDELEVRGPSVFKGYYRQPGRTAEGFRPDGFFRTGDVARIDAGGYVWLTGRTTDVIITGGENVYPREVEAAIEEIPGVAEVVVFGLPHPDFGEAVTAVVVPEGIPLSEASILSRLKEEVVSFKVPKRVLFAEGLPRNAMGKVERRVIREKYWWLFKP